MSTHCQCGTWNPISNKTDHLGSIIYSLSWEWLGCCLKFKPFYLHNMGVGHCLISYWVKGRKFVILLEICCTSVITMIPINNWWYSKPHIIINVESLDLNSIWYPQSQVGHTRLKSLPPQYVRYWYDTSQYHSCKCHTE